MFSTKIRPTTLNMYFIWSSECLEMQVKKSKIHLRRNPPQCLCIDALVLHPSKHCNTKMSKCPWSNHQASDSSREPLPGCLHASTSMVNMYVNTSEGYSYSYALCIMITQMNQTTGLPPKLLLHPQNLHLVPSPPTIVLFSQIWRVNSLQLFKAPPRHTHIMESQSRHLGCGPANIPGPLVPLLAAALLLGFTKDMMHSCSRWVLNQERCSWATAY